MRYLVFVFVVFDIDIVDLIFSMRSAFSRGVVFWRLRE